ncbi:Isoamylase, partial [Thalictrum thalictroides]
TFFSVVTISVYDFEILIYISPKQNRVTKKISLDPFLNKTGDVWHAFLKGDFENMLYGYMFDGKFSPEEGHCYDSSRILLDPYAKAVVSRGEFGALGPEENCWPQMAGMVPSSRDEVSSYNFNHCTLL